MFIEIPVVDVMLEKYIGLPFDSPCAVYVTRSPESVKVTELNAAPTETKLVVPTETTVYDLPETKDPAAIVALL